MDLARKKEVYSICQQHDLLIVEDDPYYYMQYAESRTPSLFSLDVDGRVLRTDSFSKILSSGVRVGCVTGPKKLVEQMDLHNQATIMHTSGLSQYAVLTILRHWGVGDAAGVGVIDNKYPVWEAHLSKINKFYAKQCDAFFAAAAKHLIDEEGKPLAEYRRPTAGMFVWMKLLGVEDTTQLIMTEAVEKKVLLVPGSAFFPGAPKTPYVRAAFSVATVEQIDTAMQRLGEMLRAVRARK
jgi:kynurenine/2-aminoadipate aminotransferase